MLEKYIVEDLIGADLKHLFGNVVTEPRMRLALIRAIDEIHGGETAGTFVNGNTIYTRDIEKNISILTNCLLFDIIGQLKKPTGHAVHAVPLTEHDRIPSPKEIAQVAVIANQLEEEAHKVAGLVDFQRIDRVKGQLIEGGRAFRDNVLKGLGEIGVNIKDPIELMIAIKRIGGRGLEELFGVGQKDETVAGGRHPVVPTEIFYHTQAIADQLKEDVRTKKLGRNLEGKKVMLLTTDVHEYAKLVIGIALEEAGVEVIDLGHHVDPEQIIEALLKTRADGVCISTHNGMALSYAGKLIEELERHGLKVPIFMGGRLNEPAGKILPRDVTADLRELGIVTCDNVFDVLENLP
ncbi:cobalamin-dependent protein [Chloroflexota bacterium]